MFFKFGTENRLRTEIAMTRARNDSERMDDLSAQLYALRQKETHAVEKISKAE